MLLCCAQSLSHVWLFMTPWIIAHQAPLSMGILKARILEWIAYPFSPGNLPNPEIKPASPALQVDVFTSWATREAPIYDYRSQNNQLALKMYWLGNKRKNLEWCGKSSEYPSGWLLQMYYRIKKILWVVRLRFMHFMYIMSAFSLLQFIKLYSCMFTCL